MPLSKYRLIEICKFVGRNKLQISKSNGGMGKSTQPSAETGVPGDPEKW